MPNGSTNQNALQVLEQYPAYLQPRTVTALGNRGGFSGARLWLFNCELGDMCLRSWPPHITIESLELQHPLMSRARSDGLAFVPAVYHCAEGTTWVNHEGSLWQIEMWMPGTADFVTNPSADRLRAACIALAQLHGCWKSWSTLTGLCPAVQRRLARARDWLELIASGWIPSAAAGERLQALIQRAYRLLADHVPQVAQLLAAWTEEPILLQPCLCDVWHDHILFTEEKVTGIVDYGGVKIDHPSVDIARMLGSMVGDDRAQWETGLAAYRTFRNISAEDEALAIALDETGVVIGVVNWLLWICRDGRRFDDWDRVAQRLSALLDRLEARH
jgi:Ser/Thr protein kinase RdoA (MazF antagonist)